MSGKKGKKDQGKQKQGGMPPQQPMPPAPGPPFMGRPPPYPPGAFPFPGGPPMGSPPDPNQQRLLQLQIRRQQLQLQQMQQQQVAQAQQRMSPSHKHPSPAQQQRFSSYTTTTTPHANIKQQPASAPAAAAPPKEKSPVPRKTAPPPPSPEQVKLWLSQCDWKDKTIHVARQLLGGSSINGFSKSTAALQRIKKQRARQLASVKKRAAAEMAAIPTAEQQPKPPQTAEEAKRDILNSRTAKKLQTEMQQGAHFVKNLYENIQGIMRELDPSGLNVPPPIHRLTVPSNKASTSKAKAAAAAAKAAASYTSKTKSKAAQAPAAAPAPVPGVQGSGLRKHRKRKLPNYHLDVGLSEHDASGKRVFAKKEHNLRIGEVLRFRGLRAGDYVAARVSSRDLWILARVVQDYPPISMDPNEFLKLTEAKRDALFRNKVIVKDAEEKASAEPIAVSRQLILPLPRTYAEAAEWGTRLKKGLRIYAMYPHTTSLYVATVVDNTTYCRGDDDIIVVQFDEDERDATGALPKCHIPARFAVMIPREYQATKKKASSSAKQSPPEPKQTKRASKKATTAAPRADQTDPTLNNMLNEMNDTLGDFDALVDFSDGGAV